MSDIIENGQDFYQEDTPIGKQITFVEPMAGNLPATITAPQCPVDLVGNLTGGRRNTLRTYTRWQVANDLDWTTPNLDLFRDYLLSRDEKREVNGRAGSLRVKHFGPAAPSTIRQMLSAIRARYRVVIEMDSTDNYLLQVAQSQNIGGFADCRAFADTAIKRIKSAIHPSLSKVSVKKKQDETDDEIGLRMSRNEASTLLDKPGILTLKGARDTAILAVLLCTGIRESEMCNLEVKDLRQTSGGKLVLHVRKGKGNKSRVVYWGAGAWALQYVDFWLEAAGIKDGAVFRSFGKASTTIRGRLTRHGLIQIVGQYTANLDDGTTAIVKPHDLRRTYARRCYDAKMSILGIQQNLGHSDHKTTLHYIGILNGEARQPPALYSQPHAADLAKMRKGQ